MGPALDKETKILPTER